MGTECRSTSLQGSTLAALAEFVGADLGADFSAGSDTPALGPTDEPLHLPLAELDVHFGWFDLAWRVLDDVTSDPSVVASRSTVQLWPEHFDAGTTAELSSGGNANLGFSLGDSFSEEPYVYVGPWGPERPGDPGYWNAPFGACPRPGPKPASIGSARPSSAGGSRCSPAGDTGARPAPHS